MNNKELGFSDFRGCYVGVVVFVVLLIMFFSFNVFGKDKELGGEDIVLTSVGNDISINKRVDNNKCKVIGKGNIRKVSKYLKWRYLRYSSKRTKNKLGKVIDRVLWMLYLDKDNRDRFGALFTEWGREVKNIKEFRGSGLCDYELGGLLVLGVIGQETGFRYWIIGSVGEVGLMQVIPYESHIKESLRFIRCYRDIKGLCIKERIIKEKVYSRDVRRLVKNDYLVGVEIGIRELGFWRAWYKERGYIKWRKGYNWWYLKKRKGYNDSKAWSLLTKYKRLKGFMGGWLWVYHYNWGNRVLYSKKVLRYGKGVMKRVREILKLYNIKK